jgi:arylsulfatase A-like enzyme/Flp pilus assembly protein TadD
VAVYISGWLGGHVGEKTKPNLLLITLDTTRADYLGCYGRIPAQTPNLDQLAREGVRFDRCSTCSPLTLPSHTSILTGVCPNVHGARRNGSGYVSSANVTLAETLRGAGYRTGAAIASFVLNRQFGIDQGFEDYHDVVPAADRDPSGAWRPGDAVCNDAIKLLQNRAAEPFFLWVHFFDPHYPYLSQRRADHTSPEAYADQVSFMDEQVGRLLAELRRLKLDANTIVVAVGDHGEGLGQHDEATHGFFLYETTLRVPFIVRYPQAVSAGRVISTPVRTIDVAPTVLELLGAPEMKKIEGVSLCGLLHGSGVAPASAPPAYAESFEANAQFDLSPLRSVTMDGWKYILAPESELYDLTADPNEANNLAASQPERAVALRKQLWTCVAEAPEPVQADAHAWLNTEDVKRLESLGYVGGATSMPSTLDAEMAIFEPHGGNPRSYSSLFQLNSKSRQALDEKRFPSAEGGFREIIKVVPNAAQAYAGLAEALRGQSRLDEARTAVQNALVRWPDDRYLLATHASLLADAGLWDEAAEQFRLALRQTPDDTVLLHSMAVVQMYRGRLDEAEKHLMLGLRGQPDSPQLLHAMAALRSRQDRNAEAAEYLRKALALDPGYQQAARELEQIKEALSP